MFVAKIITDIKNKIVTVAKYKYSCIAIKYVLNAGLIKIKIELRCIQKY